MADKFRRKSVQISAAQCRHERKIAAMMKDWMDGGHGCVPDKTPDGIFHIIQEDWNSIKLFTEKNRDIISSIEENREKIQCGCNMWM